MKNNVFRFVCKPCGLLLPAIVVWSLSCRTTDPTPTIFTPESQAAVRASLVSVLPTGNQTAEVLVKSSPSLLVADWQLTGYTADNKSLMLETQGSKPLTTFTLNTVRASGLTIGQTYRFRLWFLYNGLDTLRVERVYTHTTPAHWRRLAHLDADGGDFTAMLISSDNDPFGVASSLRTYRYVDEQRSNRLVYQTDQDSWFAFEQPYPIAHQEVLFRLQAVAGLRALFDAQPASIEGNVHQQADTTVLALGYFGASAIRRKRLIIPGDTINYGRFIVRYGGLFQGKCSVTPSDTELANWLGK